MHRQRERVRRESGARANGASSEARQLRNRNVSYREWINIRTDTSSEREQNFEDGETEGRGAGRDSRPHLEHRQHSGLHHIGVESSGKNRTYAARKGPGLCLSEMAMRTSAGVALARAARGDGGGGIGGVGSGGGHGENIIERRWWPAAERAQRRHSELVVGESREGRRRRRLRRGGRQRRGGGVGHEVRDRRRRRRWRRARPRPSWEVELGAAVPVVMRRTARHYGKRGAWDEWQARRERRRRQVRTRARRAARSVSGAPWRRRRRRWRRRRQRAVPRG